MKNPFRRQKEYRPPGYPHFTLQKFREKSSRPIESEWSLRLLWAKHEIYKCTVILASVEAVNGKTVNTLPWWDKDEPYHEHWLQAGGSGNVRIPKEYNPKPDDTVSVYDGVKLLWRGTWQQIITVDK